VEYAGRRFSCPDCGEVATVPSKSQVPPKSEESSGAPTSVPPGKAPPPVQTSETKPSAPATAPKSKPRGSAEDEPTTGQDAQPIVFRRCLSLEAAMDMTPMVDVTFLLLIFFMVTASYSLQKSLELPQPDVQEEVAESRTLEEIESDDDYVIVRIARDNTVWVNEMEAPSQQELLSKLREARQGPPGSGGRGPSSLLVIADPDALHEKVVMALDAGNAVGMENIRLACISEEDL